MSSNNAIVSKMNKTCEADNLFLTSVLFVICRLRRFCFGRYVRLSYDNPNQSNMTKGKIILNKAINIIDKYATTLTGEKSLHFNDKLAVTYHFLKKE